MIHCANRYCFSDNVFLEKNIGCDRSMTSFGREKKTIIIFCALILFALFGHSLAQENEPPAKLRLIQANEMAGAVERGQKLRKLSGNVRFKHGKTTITCRQSIDYPQQDRWVLIGDVNIFDDEKTLKADSVTYFAKTKIYEALKNVVLTTDSTIINTRKLKYILRERKAIADGEVKIVNTLERTQLTSEHAEYFRDDKYTLLTQNPVFIQFDSTGDEETRILGKVMESIDGGAQIKVDQDVEIFHRDIRAQCGHAEYFKNNEKIVLTTEPVVFQKNNKLEGQTIELHLANRKIKEVHVIERAMATLLPDSVQNNEKPNTISGQKLVAFINNDGVDKVSVDGTATCVYHLYEQGVYKGMNRAQGDSLTLFLFGNAIQRIIFDSKPGKSTGKFLPPGFDATVGEPDANRNQAKPQAGNGKK